MGNAPSVVEGPEKGRRTAQKLTKPRTTNVATAGLLDPNYTPNPRRRFSAARTWSLPYGTEPAPSPLYPSSDAGTADQWDDTNDSERVGRSRSVKNIFRSRSSQGRSRNGDAKQDGYLPTPAPSTRPSRANSMIVGTADHPYHGLGGRPGWSTVTPSMPSNYGISPYEAKRLLNLTEEPISYEEQSNVSEGAIRTVPSSPRLPTAVGNPASASISRAESEISLCTPMRRRSLQVPGVATRAAPQVPPLPKRSTARYSMPPTPSRRGSWDTLEMAMPSVYELSRGVAEVARASTPCEDDYKHIGAFKLGTLRITNGSPVTSPVVDTDSSDGNSGCQTTPEICNGQSYFDPINPSIDGSADATAPQKELPGRQPSVFPVSPGPKAEYLPEINSSSPFLEDRLGPVAELQIASKNTAIEDDLFAVEQAEYSQLEVLDVRVDPSAKSIPPHPCLASEGTRSREINRSDSGIVASPTSEYSQKALSKADSGYSSNVSLRSFSRTATVHRKGQAAIGEPGASPATSSPPDSTELSSREATPPPPGPDKSDVPTTPARTSRELSPAARPNLWLRGRKSLSRKAKDRLTLDSASPAQPSPTWSEFSLQSPTGSSKSASAFSISSIARKNGKLQKLLGSGRGPANLSPTHPTETTVVSPIPLEVEARFAKRTESYPAMMRRQSVKPEASKETLGTIFSVGSAEMVNEHGICLSPTVPVDAALVATPTPAVREAAAMSASNLPPPSPTVYTPVGARASEVPPSALVSGHPAVFTPTHRPRRSATFTAQPSPMEDRAHPLLGPSRPSSTLEPLSFSRKFKSPPPVSLRTRSVGSPQPPSRTQSTPPGAARAPSFNQSLSASTSWENMGHYAQEGYRGCPPAPMPVPSPGQPQPLSARSSFVRSRGNSLSSQSSQMAGEMARPKPTPQRYSTIVPPMRHRISSDGGAFHPPPNSVVDQTPIRDNGPYPLMGGKVSDPWTGSSLESEARRDRSPAQVQAQQPPRAPRSHSRNRSVGSADPHPAPYRVLHSYNSPAYRNVPIWG